MIDVTWFEFQNRLRATLRSLGDHSVLIVTAPSDTAGYVQFIVDEDTLFAEASGPEFVGGAAAHDADDLTMLAAGWTAPTRPLPNWSFELSLPALTSEYAELTDRCAVALRDVFHVEHPGSLGYRAWREPELQPPGVTWSAERIERLDPGENPLSLPELGLQPV